MRVGDKVVLADELDCIIPPGVYRVSHINSDGSFHIGGNTAVWPRRVIEAQILKEYGKC